MRLAILAVGNRMPAWIESGFREYAQRMPRDFPVDLVEVKPEKRVSGRTTEQILAAEARRLQQATPPDARRVVLDERGLAWTTRKLAEFLDDTRQSAACTAFIVGGADGLHGDVRSAADIVLSLSALTLPHGIVRVLLAEQLYRAVSILGNHPYHRD